MQAEDDEDYVPESLRRAVQAAEEQLRNGLDDVMKFDYSKPKAVPGVNALGDVDGISDDEDFDHSTAMSDDNGFFYNILAKEKDETLKRYLTRGLLQDEALKGVPNATPKPGFVPPSPLARDDDELMSPPLDEEAYQLYMNIADIQTATEPACSQNQRDPCCSICEMDPGVLTCAGTNPTHHFCSDCFNTYALTAFQEGGPFCRQVQTGVADVNGVNTVSQVEELPCPFFEHDGCSCSNIPTADLRTHLSEESFDQWRRAWGRIAVAQADRERQNVEQHQQDQPPLYHLLQAVQDALNLGASVACPNCSYRGEKDEACMHITCQNCRCRWCYCCGRPRQDGAANRCTTCDSQNIYIHNHPGWNRFEIEPGESPGYGALHEFHRRRMAYFIHRLTEGVPLAPWRELWERHGEVLYQVPTPRRQILLQDIQNAEPPAFHPTSTQDIQWLGDVDPILARLRQNLAQEVQGQNHRLDRTRGNRNGWGLRPRRRKGNYQPAPRIGHGQRRQEDWDVNRRYQQIDEVLQDEGLDPELRHAMVDSLLLHRQDELQRNDEHQNPGPRRRRFVRNLFSR